MNNNNDIKIPDIIPELERGPLWLKEKRHASREAYNRIPLPSRNLHLWRYTDPNKFTMDREKAVDMAFNEGYDIVEKTELNHLQEGNLAALVTDLGGKTINFYGLEKLISKGIVVSTLSEAVEKHYDLVEQYLYRLVNSHTGKFEALNGALWNDGIFIYIPKNMTIENPIHLLRESGLANSVQFPRLLIVVGENAELTIIDEYGGGCQDENKVPSYTNGTVELFGLENSHTRYVMLQRQQPSATFYLNHRALIEKGADMLTITLAFGGALSKHNFGVILNGPGANSNMYGLLFGSDHQHFDNHTLHQHLSGQTTSNINFKTALSDQAVSAYTGLIKIDHKSKNCEAYQENRNLLLNKGTKAETIPVLEILNEDVMCSHGATVGPVDPAQLFYLRSRGIPHTEAVRMIVNGFVDNTIKQVPKDLQKRIQTYVTERLEHI